MQHRHVVVRHKCSGRWHRNVEYRHRRCLAQWLCSSTQFSQWYRFEDRQAMWSKASHFFNGFEKFSKLRSQTIKVQYRSIQASIVLSIKRNPRDNIPEVYGPTLTAGLHNPFVFRQRFLDVKIVSLLVNGNGMFVSTVEKNFNFAQQNECKGIAACRMWWGGNESQMKTQVLQKIVGAWRCEVGHCIRWGRELKSRRTVDKTDRSKQNYCSGAGDSSEKEDQRISSRSLVTACKLPQLKVTQSQEQKKQRQYKSSHTTSRSAFHDPANTFTNKRECFGINKQGKMLSKEIDISHIVTDHRGFGLNIPGIHSRMVMCDTAGGHSVASDPLPWLQVLHRKQ